MLFDVESSGDDSTDDVVILGSAEARLAVSSASGAVGNGKSGVRFSAAAGTCASAPDATTSGPFRAACTPIAGGARCHRANEHGEYNDDDDDDDVADDNVDAVADNYNDDDDDDDDDADEDDDNADEDDDDEGSGDGGEGYFSQSDGDEPDSEPVDGGYDDGSFGPYLMGDTFFLGMLYRLDCGNPLIPKVRCRGRTQAQKRCKLTSRNELLSAQPLR